MIAYQFDEDYGARENLSILYNDVLIVLADPAKDQKAVDAVVEKFISFDPKTYRHDNEFDRNDLVKELAKNGWQAEFLTPNIYVDENF